MKKRKVSIICFMLTILLVTKAVAAIPVSEGYDRNSLYSAVHGYYVTHTE